MVLLPEKVFKDMKGGNIQEGGKKEADDLRMAKFQDAYIRSKNEKEIREDHDWDKLGSRLKPMFKEPAENNDVNEMIKKYPTRMQPQVQFILKLLSNLPKVKLEKDRVIVDGSPIRGSLEDVIGDIMINEVSSTEQVIKQLRSSNAKGNENEDMPFESIADTMEQYLSSQPTTPFQTPKAGYITPFQSPGDSPRNSRKQKRSPYETRSKRAKSNSISPQKLLRKALESEEKRMKKNGQKGKGASAYQGRWEPY